MNGLPDTQFDLGSGLCHCLLGLMIRGVGRSSFRAGDIEVGVLSTLALRTQTSIFKSHTKLAVCDDLGTGDHQALDDAKSVPGRTNSPLLAIPTGLGKQGWLLHGWAG